MNLDTKENNPQQDDAGIEPSTSPNQPEQATDDSTSNSSTKKNPKPDPTPENEPLSESKLDLCKESLPALPEIDRAKKFQLFLDKTLQGWSEDICAKDSQASVKASGSFITRPEQLRHGSDIDVLVFAPSLKDPDQYVHSLKDLNTRAHKFRQEQGIDLVFFTQAANETAFTFFAGEYADRRRGAQAEQPTALVPCHLLYYGDAYEFLQREPEYLTNMIMHSAQSIAGPDISIDSNPNKELISLFETVEWNVERILAALILNDGFLPRKFLIQHGVDQLFSTLRLVSIGLNKAEKKSARRKSFDVFNTLETLDPPSPETSKKTHDLLNLIQPVKQVRDEGAKGNAQELHDAVKVSSEILKALKGFRQSYVAPARSGSRSKPLPDPPSTP